MGDGESAAGILCLLLLFFIDVFLYGFGAAIINLNEKEVERRAEEEKDKKSMRLLRVANRAERYIDMVQMLTTMVNIVAGALLLDIWMRRLDFVPLALLYIFLAFGVLLPKKVAARKPEEWAYACIGPANVMMTIFAPVTVLVGATVKGILYLFGVRGDEDDDDVTEEEIINMVQESFEQGNIEDSEAEMISNIFEFDDKQAQAIMTRRANIVAIDGESKLQDAIDFMLEGTNSRYPVYEESIDRVIGILHLKDALRYQREHGTSDACIKDLENLLREARFVLGTRNIDELFEEMRAEKLQMVIVVDEYGQVDGLVTMEDILEEIVGNILDEYDEVTNYIQDNGNDEYIMEGKTPLADVAERFDINFDGEEFETLNGFMIYRLDHIPEAGEEFDVDYQGYNFKILSVENKMVQSVLVTKLAKEGDEAAEDVPEDMTGKQG